MEVYSDIDISGRKTSNRPGLLKLVAHYNDGKFDVAVADDYSRFSRDMEDGAGLIGHMDIATYAEGVPDPGDDFAPLLYMLLAHKYSQDMSKRWKAAHGYRLAQGLPPNGMKQFGYTKLQNGHYVINPEEAEVLRHLYAEYTRGVGTIRLVQWLAKQGVTSTRGTEFSTATLFKLLDKPFAAGFVVWAGVQHKGSHEPILSEREWVAYQDARTQRKIQQAPRNPKWWLAGIARCGRCGGTIVSTTIKGKQSVSCSTYNNKGKDACKGVFRDRRKVEVYVGTWLLLNLRTFVDAMPSDDEARNAAEDALGTAQATLDLAKGAMTNLLLNIASLPAEMTAEAVAVRRSEIESAEELVRVAQLEIASFTPADNIAAEFTQGFRMMGMTKEGKLPDDALPEFRRVVAKIISEVRIMPPENSRDRNRDMTDEIVVVPRVAKTV